MSATRSERLLQNLTSSDGWSCENNGKENTRLTCIFMYEVILSRLFVDYNNLTVPGETTIEIETVVIHVVKCARENSFKKLSK